MAKQYTCPFCNSAYTEDESATACARCALFGAGGCKKMRCPHCGYEVPAPTRASRALEAMLEKIRGKKS